MSFVVPYTRDMRLGQGFNSFTRETCIDDAVLILPSKPSQVLNPPPAEDVQYVPEPGTADGETPKPPVASAANVNGTTSLITASTPIERAEKLRPVQHTRELNQTVVFSCYKVEHVTDILSALNVSAYASVKYGTIMGSGSANFVNEKKISEADLNYVVSVVVTNESSRENPKLTFNPIPEAPLSSLDAKTFTSIFGDCFIVDFLEGGEFSAVISVQTSSDGDTKKVQAALELQLQTNIPGLKIGAGSSVDKKKEFDMENCEVTVSVSWSGGGCIRESTSNWSIADVISVANYFPNQCAKHPTPTSAVLMNYISLRSFNAELMKQSAAQVATMQNGTKLQLASMALGRRQLVLDYTAASIVAKDIFSRYMAWKGLWQTITTIMGSPEEWQPRERGTSGLQPIGTDPESLNLARLKCREGMVQCLQEVEALKENPPTTVDLAPAPAVPGNLVNGDGPMRRNTNDLPPHPGYSFPAELAARLPWHSGAPPVLDQNTWAKDNITVDESRVIAQYTPNKDYLAFSPPYGDNIADNRGVSVRAFCTLTDINKTSKPAALQRLALHGHEHHFFKDLSNLFSRGDLHPDLKQFSPRYRGALSHIGLTTSSSPPTPPPTSQSASSSTPLCRTAEHFPKMPTHKHDPRFVRTEDISRSGGIMRVEVGFVDGDGCIASLQFFNAKGERVHGWDMYNFPGADWKEHEKRKPKVWIVTPPSENELDDLPDRVADVNGNGDAKEMGGPSTPAKAGPTRATGRSSRGDQWELVGFYGTAHLVIEHIGFIWGKV